MYGGGGGGYPPGGGPPGYPPGGGPPGYPPGYPQGQPQNPYGAPQTPPMYAPGVAPAPFGAPVQSFGMVPAAPFGIDPLTGIPYSDKEKTTAGLLQIFLPSAGRFYLGHTGVGVAQLLLTIFCGVGLLWTLIDGIMMLTGSVRDINGRPLRG